MDEARLRALIHMSITEMRIRIFAGVEMDEARLRALIPQFFLVCQVVLEGRNG